MKSEIKIVILRITIEEIKAKAATLENIEGMTGNERLILSGLLAEFEKAKAEDNFKARLILELLRFDEVSIQKILDFTK